MENNDGFSVTPICASNLDGGPVFNSSPIIGTNASCNFSTETYSINVTGSTASTTYTWSVPAGASILSGQGTTSVFISFGNTSGNVSVSIANECGLQVVSQPISIANCIFYSGGNNDGFSVGALTCVSDLNGTNFVPGAIVGSTTYCQFSTESYTISTPGAISLTWSVPAGASIVSGQGTNSVLVSFGNTDGNVSVQVVDPCNITTVNLPVTNANCVFYAGGNTRWFLGNNYYKTLRCRSHWYRSTHRFATELFISIGKLLRSTIMISSWWRDLMMEKHLKTC
ncbi:MAG: hypothetical protein WDO15_14890 [Bacteroidota bacterium]